MKTLVVYFSVHHHNTEKLAKVLAEELNADMVDVKDSDAEKIRDYDLIGFGSGIYFNKHHKTLIEFVNKLPSLKKKAFIFSTSGVGGTSGHRMLRTKLLEKGFEIVGEFSCKGFDTIGPLKLFGGINKGRPNDEDLARAKEFAKGLKP